MTVKQVAGGLALVFVVVLAVAVAKQLSTEAMAVIIGVVCGVGAGLPTSVLLLAALSRRDRQRLDEIEQRTRRGQGAYPPLVVIQGGAPQALPSAPQAGFWPTPQSSAPARQGFRIVGGDDLLLDDNSY